MTASALFGSPSTTSSPINYRSTAISSHHDTAADGSNLSATAADAASSPAAASDGDWEAVRLMTAAQILSSSSSTDDITLSHDDDSSVLSVATSAQQDGPDLGPDPLGPLALLDDLHTLDADSLALAVGILRQHQPVDATEDGVQLSERLRDFLMVLRKRPATSAAGEVCLHMCVGISICTCLHVCVGDLDMHLPCICVLVFLDLHTAMSSPLAVRLRGGASHEQSCSSPNSRSRIQDCLVSLAVCCCRRCHVSAQHSSSDCGWLLGRG